MGILHGHILQVIPICLISVNVAFSEPDFLPPPKNISINSTNLIHVLHWDPEPEMWGIVNYSVQIQGEYERIYSNQTWDDIEECQNIPQTYCNVTEDVAGNVFYAFRVQSLYRNQISAWAEMETYFNRVTTVLTPPAMELQQSGHKLFVKIQNYGEQFYFFVHYWPKGKEESEKSIRLEREITSAVLEIDPGNEYCAYVIANAIPISRNSSKSNPVCLKTQAPVNVGLIIGLLCGMIVALMLLALPARKAWGLMCYSCCPQEEIPGVLMEPSPGRSRKSINKYCSDQDRCGSKSSIELDELIVCHEKCPDNIQIPR